VKWVTRPTCHIDRVACAWLILRFVDQDAEFIFVDDAEDLPAGGTPFDVPGTPLSHHGDNCTFETMLEQYHLDDPALRDIANIVHEADLGDERFDAPEAAGLDVIIRGMSMVAPDHEMVRACLPIFDGLYEYRRRANDLGTLPA